MDGQKPDAVEEQSRAETPEDVAVLYSWANLQGARYRDFSGLRRESRAMARHRAAQEAREAERRAQAEAEAAAALAERAAREAEEIARLHAKAARKAAEARQRRELEMEEGARAQAMRQASELSRKAAAERMQAARRAEAAASAEAAAKREVREIAEAHASAERQALRYAEAEMRRRTLAGPQPVSKLPGEITDPYQRDQEPAGRLLIVPDQDMRPTRFPITRDARQMLPKTEAAEAQTGLDASAEGKTDLEPSLLEQSPERNSAGAAVTAVGTGPGAIQEMARAAGPEPKVAAATERVPSPAATMQSAVAKAQSAVAKSEMPAWLATPEWTERREETVADESPVEDTLQQSRERVASRWFALRGLFDRGVHEPAPETQPSRSGEVPVLAVFSLAGGVGKTSLVATLGRALAASGEKVLLTDTTSHGLLPFYFGATELRPGVVRTFSPPIGGADAPVHMVSFDLREKVGDLEAQEELAEELTRDAQGMQRVLVDLSPLTPWVARRLARMNTTVVVPLAPDLSSIISLTVVEKFFSDIKDANDRPVHPYYLLNGFDASQPLHLDVREVLRQQLGERLLPFVIRRSPAVPEALAEGMTVMDYAPESPVAQDFMNLVSWLRTHSAPAPGFRKVRWSEQ